ncbi:uncharacterized protein LOC129966528 isoform X1 [Argiope bruennichi]|uniref:uncharacterized protein LOC129966528 isoform X1 n=1 Tax=Argiope bruennichi TaxID=94029 RepID=UPI002494BB8B|nr:uncharacterized protein LOC129966528 isoform X1 [Argiope bruennichi]
MALLAIPFLFWLASSIVNLQAKVVHMNSFNLIVDLDRNHWADVAFDFIANMSCRDTFLTTEEDCNRLVSIRKSDMNFYSAPVSGNKYRAVLPDGPLTRTDVHDAILVIDPYPEANLGHLLVVFYVDLGWTELQCKVNGGQYTDDGACLSLALRKRCHNLLLRKLNSHRKKQCEINFFPLVHFANEEPSQRSQKLECRDFMTGFAPCPNLRPRNHTDNLFCDALEENTLRCSTSSTTVGIRCRLFERCDHAVLISGGWDRLTDRPLYLENMVRFHDMLMNNGFIHSNVKMFFSNGNNGIDKALGINDEVFPAAFKLTMRYHIRKICQTMHCADSFVIYLNSPTTNEGSSLLWDIDRNGQADDSEIYTIRELLQDTQDCMAQQLYIIADQNFSGKLIHALEHSSRHQNVMAFASGREHEYSWNGDFTTQWTAYNSKQDCIAETHEAVKTTMNSSEPLLFDGSNGILNTTIYGAPCNVLPPYTEHELQKSFYGCQYLPTSVWLRRGKHYFNAAEEEDYEE